MPRHRKNPPPPAPASWDSLPDDHLFAVGDLDRTPLAVLCRRARYALLNSGALKAVVVGRRRYIRRAAITEYLRSNERCLVTDNT